jgi:hypothetical protein
MADPEPNRRWQQRFLDDGTATLYVDTDDGELGRAFQKAVGSTAKAFVNGAYSSLDNTYDAVRAAGRGLGVLGPEEFRRFGQEADFIGASLGRVGPTLGQIVKHPKLAARAAGRVLAEAWDPLLPFHLAGRYGMGALTGFGAAAMAGGVLRAVENGHNLFDAIVYPGIQGRPPPAGLLGIPPEGHGLLGIPPQDVR